jgi:uncharacterized phage protein (TIGR02218 family)
MRTLPANLAAHLAQDTTTLCSCWRITKVNGGQLGFTDHDRALAFDGTAFEAQSGYTGSEIESSLGLSVDNLEATGALESARLDEQQLKSGDFDHAEVEIWRVNWQDVTQRLLVRKGHLGEVTYGAGRFTAEVRGLAHLFNQPQGRLYQYGCDAELGDARCKVDLGASAFRGNGVITAASGASLETSGLTSFANDWFTRGLVEFTSGANAGRKFRVKRHQRVGTISRFDLWQPPPQSVLPGEAVVIRAGCDKQFPTCRGKFANAENYRGFPHMPGNDFVMQVASAGDAANDGGRRG